MHKWILTQGTPKPCSFSRCWPSSPHSWWSIGGPPIRPTPAALRSPCCSWRRCWSACAVCRDSANLEQKRNSKLSQCIYMRRQLYLFAVMTNWGNLILTIIIGGLRLCTSWPGVKSPAVLLDGGAVNGVLSLETRLVVVGLWNGNLRLRPGPQCLTCEQKSHLQTWQSLSQHPIDSLVSKAYTVWLVWTG